MKKYFILAAAALAFAACTNDEIVPVEQVQQVVDDGSIQFDSYVSRGTTRAGQIGEMTTSKLEASTATLTESNGFGVFGYYTDGELYAGTTKPNFFYNQKVYYESGWKYSPVKYWPNEFGSDAISDQVDRLSFFAYAPYVQVDPLTGIVTTKNTENIMGMTRNNATGDPFVKYAATMDPTNTVDLCYGVAAEDFTSSVSTSFPNDITAGDPFVNMTKPGLGSKIKFNFKHALSKLNVKIDAFVDATNPPTSVLNGFTKIWVRSVTFEGITSKGSLNLREGEWYLIDAAGDNKISSGTVTVYDGRKDGKEPVGIATNEAPAMLNPALVQSLPYDKASWGTALQTTTPASVKGVTEAAQNLFNSATPTDPIYVIPTGEKLKVTIVYDVETYDKNLAFYLSDGVTPGSTIQNTITKTIDSFGEIKAGFQYVLNLHLGMKSVEFDAVVAGWDESISAADAKLPSNAPSVAAGNPLTDATAVVDADADSYTFEITGLTASEAVAGAGATGNIAGVTSAAANASGVASETVTISKNKTVNDVVNTAVTWTGSSSGKGVSLEITQKAHPLGLTVTGTAGNATLTLVSSAEDINWTADVVEANIKVTKNGAPVTFTWTSSTATLSLDSGDKVAGEKYAVTVKAGNAPVETYTLTVGS